jgi:hypothetical protein
VVVDLSLIFPAFAKAFPRVNQQDIVLVKHAAQQALHSMAAEEGKQLALAATRFLPFGDESCQVWPVVQKPFQMSGKFWRLCQAFGFENLNGEKGESSPPSNEP